MHCALVSNLNIWMNLIRWYEFLSMLHTYFLKMITSKSSSCCIAFIISTGDLNFFGKCLLTCYIMDFSIRRPGTSSADLRNHLGHSILRRSIITINVSSWYFLIVMRRCSLIITYCCTLLLMIFLLQCVDITLMSTF